MIAAAENDFETPVFAAHGNLREIKRSLQAQGAEIALLSGSGATVFGMFADEARARIAQAQFASEKLMNVFVVPTCSAPARLARRTTTISRASVDNSPCIPLKFDPLVGFLNSAQRTR